MSDMEEAYNFGRAAKYAGLTKEQTNKMAGMFAATKNVPIHLFVYNALYGWDNQETPEGTE